MIQNSIRKALAAWPGISLYGGSIEGWTSDMISPWWANGATGTDSMAAVTNFSLSGFKPSATVRIEVVPDPGYAGAFVQYSKNNGANITYSSDFALSSTDLLKIGIIPIDQVSSGYGQVRVYANNALVLTIAYGYDPA